MVALEEMAEEAQHNLVSEEEEEAQNDLDETEDSLYWSIKHLPLVP